MENKQDLEHQLPQWIETWSKYILQQSSTGRDLDQKSNHPALGLVQDLLLSSTRGDSCIRRHHQNIQLLDNLVIDEKKAHTQIAPFVVDNEYVYLYRYWNLEKRLATQILRLKQQKVGQVDIQAFTHLLEDPYQKKALEMVAENALNIITGGPGTGKTYTLARIIAVLSQTNSHIRIAMAAPTGKAAQRMKEALQHSLNDEKLNQLGLVSGALKQQDTLTIHRLLGLGTQYKARFNLKQPLPYDLIVIDEASMLDLHLATLLFEAIPEHCRLILLGDANQLASVDVGSVLADLQRAQSLEKNRVNLVNSRRFKSDALIGKMAKFIQTHKSDAIQEQVAEHLKQLLPKFEREIVASSELIRIELQENMPDKVQLEYLKDEISTSDLSHYYEKLSWGYTRYFNHIQQYLKHDHPENEVEMLIQIFDQYRILTAVHHGVLGLDVLNKEMEKALFAYIPNLFKQGDWYVGRPVMMSYNDYQLGISNGDIGICFQHRQQKNQFEVYFPSLNKWIPAARLPKSIQTAFVLTIHKSQGSEFTHTAVVLDSSATKLLSQELIYTAITRAKSIVSLLVHPDAFKQSLVVATTRNGGLLSKINNMNF